MEYDTGTALIVVDIQNDFADPKGSLYVNGGEEIVSVLNREIDKASGGGALVVYTQDWHPPETPHFEKDGGIWPVHCVMGTWGAEFHPDLGIAGEVIRKGSGGEDGYSAFTARDPETDREKPTGLEDTLRAHNIERVAVIGLATDYCVKETALDSARKGFSTTILSEGIRAVDRAAGDGKRALEEVRRAGGVVE
jgi:nicotinamidase/pyrazinamidase